MRNKKIILSSIILSTNLMAGSIDYLSQQDAEYLAHPAMVGKIGVSGAYYNPAGLVWLEDGLYVQINNQTHLKKYSMEYTNSKGELSQFKSDKSSLAVPSVQIVKKVGENAFFLNVGAIAGGGSVAYDGGIATFPEIANKFQQVLGDRFDSKFTTGSTIHGKSYYVAFQGGIARKFNETWSGAIGLRLVDAERKFKGEGNFEISSKKYEKLKIKPKFDIDSERTAFGVAGIFGLNYHPNEKLNLAIRYETETKLDFDNKESNLKKGFLESTPLFGNQFYNIIKKDAAIRQWMSEGSGKRNLPAVGALGMSYKISDRTTILASGNYYFIKEAGDDLGNFDNYDNGYEVSLGLDYELNSKWILMTGYQYTNTGANEKTYTDTDYVLDANMYSMGAKYKYNRQLEFLTSYSLVHYKTDENIKNITYKKSVNSFGLGAIYKF